MLSKLEPKKREPENWTYDIENYQLKEKYLNTETDISGFRLVLMCNNKIRQLHFFLDRDQAIEYGDKVTVEYSK